MTLDPRARRRLRRALEGLLLRHGPQGWWPVRAERGTFRGPADPRHESGYHPADPSVPATRAGRWEVVTGAVLTQNTAWTNVERALDALAHAGVRSPETLLALSSDVLAGLIRPAGYFNQKSRYLRSVAEWFLAEDPALSIAPPSRATLAEARRGLLAVRGVGPETADSILLYAYRLPTFVVDAYTRRVLDARGLLPPGLNYEALRAACEAALEAPTPDRCVPLWQEAHAVLVEEAKRTRSKPTSPR
jgi:endonuclease-3 related protein